MSNYIDNLTPLERQNLIQFKKLTDMSNNTHPKNGKLPFETETLNIHIQHLNLLKSSHMKLLSLISDIQNLVNTKYENFNISIHVNKQQ